MKRIAVVCNNKQEWEYFVNTLQWKLSKENKPYKSNSNFIIDKDRCTEYDCVLIGNDYIFRERLQGNTFNDYILMSGLGDDMMKLLLSEIRGDNI